MYIYIYGWWFQTWLLFSISYMGCHPSHWRTHSIIFQDGHIAPPTRWLYAYTHVYHGRPGGSDDDRCCAEGMGHLGYPGVMGGKFTSGVWDFTVVAMAISELTGYFYGIIHSINGVFLVLITGILGHNCRGKMRRNRSLRTRFCWRFFMAIEWP